MVIVILWVFSERSDISIFFKAYEKRCIFGDFLIWRCNLLEAVRVEQVKGFSKYSKNIRRRITSYSTKVGKPGKTSSDLRNQVYEYTEKSKNLLMI